MLDYIGEEDTVVVHSMDRLARNLDDLGLLVQQLTSRGIRIKFLKEGLNFSGDDSPMANFLLSVMGVFVEFERSLIKEQQQEGVELVKKRDVCKGRKKLFSEKLAEDLCVRAGQGEKKSELAREFGISRETLYQYLKAAQR